MATIEERFNAAVNVIRGLPKNGSYQPSSAMMLTFYAYFKQATEGSCKKKKPAFWDVVNKAKWDAWHALGDMTQERAMELYVDELKKIIETMSYTENVANFMGSINELDNINVDDLETVAPEIIKAARSDPNSPFASRGNSPQHMIQNSKRLQNGYTNGVVTIASSSESNSYLHQNGHLMEQSDEEYIDTVEDEVEIPSYKKQRVHPIVSSQSDTNFELPKESIVPFLQQILSTVQRMNADINNVNQRITALEKHYLEMKNIQVSLKSKRGKYPQWWPFEEISPMWFVILIAWPFIFQRVGRILQRRK